MTELQQFATRLVSALESATSADAGVQVVLTYLAAYRGQTVSDIAGATGFTESAVSDYLAALSSLVDESEGIFRLSGAGEALLTHALTTPAAGATVKLTPAQLARWAEVRKIVMDTPSPWGGPNLREMMSRYFDVQDGAPVTDDEAGELHCFFCNQGTYGISIHRPGTVPAVDMPTLLRPLGEPYKLRPSDAKIIERALRAGYTFW